MRLKKFKGVDEGHEKVIEALSKTSNFYSNDNKECKEAEISLVEAGVKFTKIYLDSPNAPTLVSFNVTSKGIEEINGFIELVQIIRRDYKLEL